MDIFGINIIGQCETAGKTAKIALNLIIILFF